jgi:hypothetical protein
MFEQKKPLELIVAEVIGTVLGFTVGFWFFDHFMHTVFGTKLLLDVLK